jgi:hypothetical protein
VNAGILFINGTLQDPGINGGVTVNSGGTLGGTGVILATVVVHSGATLMTGTNISTLSISNTVTFGATTTTFMKLNKSLLTNDLIQGITTMTLANSKLAVTNLGGALAVGDRFKLFDASFYDGAFGSISPSAPGPGLAWDLSTLATDGTLRVTNAVAPPVITSVTLSGTEFILSGTNGGASGNYIVLSSTNIMTPLGSWIPLTTNAFVDGTFSFTNTIDPGETQRYFTIQLP